jgi:ubiquinone/menaquinone biosynthesis C-methylase UbiE
MLPDLDQWDRAAEEYARVEDELHQHFLHPAIEETVRSDCARGRSLLDFGCGPGDLTARFLDSFERVVVVDQSRRALEIARRRLGSRAAAMTVEEIALSDEIFDTVLLSLVLTTVPTDDQASDLLTLLTRLLAPKARLLLATTHPCFTFRALSQVPYVQSGASFPVPIGKSLQVVEYHRPLADVLNLLGKAGLRIIRAREVMDSVDYYVRKGEPAHRFAGALPMFLILTCDYPRERTTDEDRACVLAGESGGHSLFRSHSRHGDL